MFTKLRKTAEAGANVVETQLGRAGAEFRRAGVVAAAMVAAGAVGGMAVCGMLAGLVVLAAPHLGVAGALLLVGGVTVLAVALVTVPSARTTLREARAARARAATARDRLHDLVSPSSSRSPSSSSTPASPAPGASPMHPLDHPSSAPPAASASPAPARSSRPRGETPDLAQEAVNIARAHPMLVTSAAFAVVSLFGLRRTLRLAKTATALASAGALIATKVITDQHEQVAQAAPCPPPAPAPSVPSDRMASHDEPIGTRGDGPNGVHYDGA